MDIMNIFDLFKKKSVKQSNSFSRSSFRPISSRNTTSLESLRVGMDYNGALKVSIDTYFAIIAKNIILSSGLKLLSRKIGRKGFTLEDSTGKKIKNPEIEKKIREFFGNSFTSYIYTSLLNYIIAWQKISTTTKLNKYWKNAEGGKINILDPRMIKINTNKETWEVETYQYHNSTQSLDLKKEVVYDNILFPDLDRDGYGQSQMESIVIDAITDYMLSNRQMNFYRNNATPDTIYMMSDDMDQEDVDRFETKIQEKYGWVANTGKPLVSNAIQSVRTIDIPKIDVISEKEMLMKVASIVIWVDPRIMGYMKDKWGSFAEIDAVARSITNPNMNDWTEILENDINIEFNKFVEEIPYRIVLQTLYFTNVEKDKEMSLKEVEAWITTIDEYREKYWMKKD